jgi:hypothetical protein
MNCRYAPPHADGVEASRPQWFAAFLADRGTRKPSAHTLKAYRQDFDPIATLIAGGDLSGMTVEAITVRHRHGVRNRSAENDNRRGLPLRADDAGWSCEVVNAADASSWWPWGAP